MADKIRSYHFFGHSFFFLFLLISEPGAADCGWLPVLTAACLLSVLAATCKQPAIVLFPLTDIMKLA